MQLCRKRIRHKPGPTAATSFRNAILRAAFSTVASQERIRSPWGSYPGYIGLIQRDFNRADEDAWLLGLSYDFKDLGLERRNGLANYAEGNDAHDPQTGEKLPDQRELDLTIDYRVPGEWSPGLWFRLRESIVDRQGEDKIRQFRLIVNYDVPVF